MTRAVRVALLALAAGTPVAATRVGLSDPIGIYGIIDRVVLTPDTANPSAIQLWGAFALSENVPGDNYRPAQRGYLYFSMDQARSQQIRAEWSDLKHLAGSGTPVGFGAKYSRTPTRLRCPTETPANPDVYTTNIGIAKLSDRGNTNAAVIDTQLRSKNVPTAPCPAGK